MKICPVTGRAHRTPTELRTELARLDKLIKDLLEIEKGFPAAAWDGKTAVHPAVAAAWNATNDAIDALKRERADVELNPRPIPWSEAGTYDLVKQNID
jgi:hypothetical protein